MPTTAEQNLSVSFAFLFDGDAAPQVLSAEQVDAWDPQQGLLWSHWNAQDASTAMRLQERLKLTSASVQRFCNMKAHPAFMADTDSFYLVLHSTQLDERSRNTSTHFYFSPHEIISISNDLSPTVQEMKNKMQSGMAVYSMDRFMAELISRMTHNLYVNLDRIEEEVDELTKKSLHKNNGALRADIANMRRRIITMRQYFSPACDAFLELSHTPISWISASTNHLIKLLAEQYRHVLQGLDSALARAAVTHEELVTQITVQLDRRMFMLALVATIFLPLGFLAGLFGVNLGGMPGAHNPWAFTILCVVCVAMAVIGVVPAWFILRNRNKNRR